MTSSANFWLSSHPAVKPHAMPFMYKTTTDACEPAGLNVILSSNISLKFSGFIRCRRYSKYLEGV